MMKILMINYEYPPLGGGAGNATANLAREMAAQGHEVIVMTSYFKGFARHERVDGYRIMRIPARRAALDRSNPLEMLIFLASSLWVILRMRPQVDYTIAFFGIPSAPAAWLLKLLRGTPYIVSLRGGDVPGFQPYDLKNFHRVTRPIIKFLWKHAAHVVANSQRLAELAHQTMPHCTIHVIPNGVDTDFYSPSGNTPSPKQWIFAGRLRMLHKGLHFLIDAVAVLPLELREDLSVTLVGDGPDRPQLEQRMLEKGVREHFIITGWQEKEQVRNRYREHTGLILPSQDEGMPNVVLEAMACGLAIIATDTAGTHELLSGNGWLVPVADVPALANALREALTSLPDELLEQRKRSRQIALNYQWREMAQRHLELMT